MLDFIVWNADPDIFSFNLFGLGMIRVRWYGLMFAIGFIVGFNIVAAMFKREGAPEKWLGTLLMWVIAGTVIGSRLGHVFFYQWDYYSQHLSEIPMIWEGGLASHGGAIGVILGVIFFSIFTSKRSPLWTFDRLTVAIALVGCLIRIGNLMNSEIFGHATTLPWGFMFPRSYEWRTVYPGQACHPTQIYEALTYLALFGLLMWMYWKKNCGERPGLIFGTFLVGIFLPRFLIEFIKNDQVAFEANMTLNMGQWLSIPFVLFGIFLICRAFTRPRIKYEYPNRFAPEATKANTKRKK